MGQPVVIRSYLETAGVFGMAFAFAAACTVTFATAPSHACTAVLVERGGPVLARNYDWDTGAGLVVINKRGVDKEALVLASKDTPATWRSQFASVTFNQYGREFPAGGMNEAGLAVEALWLSSTAYPPADDRPVVNELQRVQQALDRHATVASLVAAAPALRISKAYGRTHYLACDASAACAVFEYLNGALVTSTGAALAAKALTNDTYARSTAFLREHVGFGGAQPIGAGSSSLERFARGSAFAARHHAAGAPDLGFALLAKVAQGQHTKWSLVYALAERRVYFRTLAARAVKFVDLASFDGSCSTPALALDIDAPLEGDVVAAFQPCSRGVNQALLNRSLGPIEDALPPGAGALVAAYPDSLRCTTGRGSSDSAPAPAPALPVRAAPTVARSSELAPRGCGATGAGCCATSRDSELSSLGVLGLALAASIRRRRRWP